MPTTTKRVVFVYLPDSPVAVPAGNLALEEEGRDSVGCSFGYGARYLQRPNAIPVDPVSLPLSCEPGNLKLYEPTTKPPFFGAIRDAAPDFWGRRVIDAKLKVPADSLPESRYLTEAGTHRFGALDFRQNPADPEQVGQLPPVMSLEHLLEAADRIQLGEPVPAHLDAIFGVGSMGGARPKALVERNGVQYLAKFPAKKDTFDVPRVERAVLELARQAHLNVPETDLVPLIDGRAIMLIRRFDRTALPDGSYARTHCVSALTLTGKYEDESLGSPYAELADLLGTYGANHCIGTDREELFRRIVFSILVSNDDDHLRNHAFCWQPTGGWSLSPLYDVVPRPQIAQERLLHMGVGPQGRTATLDNLFQEYGRYGLDRRRAYEVMDDVCRTVRAWKTVFDQCHVPEAEMLKVESAFRKPREVGMDLVARQVA